MRSRDSIALLVLLSATGLTQAQQFPGWNPAAASMPTEIILVGSETPSGAGTASISSSGVGVRTHQRQSARLRAGEPDARTAALIPTPTPAMIAPTPAMSAPTPAVTAPITSAPIYATVPTRSYSTAPDDDGPSQEYFGEFLLWYTKSAPKTVPLVTSAPAGAAFVGQPGTTILSGNENFDYGITPGFRIGGTTWVGEGTLGLTGSFFFLGRQAETHRFDLGETGDRSLARPFIVNGTGNAGSLAVSLPGFATGSVVVDSTSELFGFDLNAIAKYSPMENLMVKGLLGFRYTDLLDRLSIHQGTLLRPGASQPFGGNTVQGPALLFIADEYDTRNRFGPQVGTQIDYRQGRFNASLGGKIAFGSMRQVLDIRGISAATPIGSGIGIVGAGGLLAQPLNTGRYDRDQFAVIPEIGAKVGFNITDHLSASVGYEFLYISNVIRPGNQIDSTVSPGLIVTSSSYTGVGTRPSVVMDSTDYWAQGISFGIAYQY